MTACWRRRVPWRWRDWRWNEGHENRVWHAVMRLTSLRLRRYGPFEDVALTLDPVRVNLIRAPNGAGKSVLRQAFVDLLFGIGGKSKMDFRYQGNMHIAAEAITRTGEGITFGRRKGHGNTLTDAAGTPTETLSLAPHLGATDRDGLERLFALDTEKLRQGGFRLMASGGLVADALLSAGGLGGARDAKRQLDAQADALAPSRKSSQRPFYLAADRFVAARRAAADALLKPDTWVRLTQEIKEAVEALDAARAKAAASQAATNRLQRLRRVRPTLASLDASAAWLQAHPDAPVLADSLPAMLEQAAASARAAAEKARAETLRRDALAAELAAIAIDSALLAQAPAIELLAEHAGAVTKALADVPVRQAELAQIEARIKHRLRSLGTPAAEPARLIPPRAAATTARQLIRSHGAHDEACRAATRAREDAARKLAELDASPAPAAPAQPILAALIDDIGAEGDPAAQSRAASRRLDETQAALALALADTPFWNGTVDALRALVMPAAPALAQAHAVLASAEQAQQRDSQDAADAAGHLAAARARLAETVGDRIVPDREAVAAARGRRQALWDLVARIAFGGAAPTASELAALQGQTLALAYERAVVAADVLADRRADESGLIERAVLAAQQVAQAELAAERASTRAAASATALTQAQAAWRVLVPDALPAACRLEDVRAFTAARTRALEKWEAAELARAAAASLAERHAGWAGRLSEALPNMAATDLPSLLAVAKREVARAAEAEKQAAAREAARRQLADRHQAAIATCGQAEAGRAAWQAEWAAALLALGRPDGEAPGTTEDILGVLGELDADLNLAAGLTARIGAMQNDNARFAADVAVIVRAVTPDDTQDLTPAAALIRLRTLRQRAVEASKAETQRTTLLAQLAQADRQVAELAQARVQREADLASVLAAIGAEDVAQAELCLAASAERGRHAATVADCMARLAQDGDGIAMDVLRGELAGLSAEDIAREIYTAEAEANAAQALVEQHSGQVATLRGELARREQETGYDDAVAAQQEAAAAAGRALREALVAKLAATLLGDAMAAVERDSSPEMLRRIGDWFGRLTGGAYPSIGVEETESGAALILSQRGFPHETKQVDQLSEGTRDQLYLALRLAAIESHPLALPFIGDDILQTFDDSRAAAALSALSELCAHTQVILLTHHNHIAELAAERFAGKIHVAELKEAVLF